jgi:hypothetical protein
MMSCPRLRLLLLLAVVALLGAQTTSEARQGRVPSSTPLEGLRRYVLSPPNTRPVSQVAALELRGTKIDELLRAARGGALTDRDVATFAQSARATTLAAIEQRAHLPRGFFLSTTRSVQFSSGNPFLGGISPGAAEQRRLKTELTRRLEEIVRLYRQRGGRALPHAVQLLTSTSQLIAPTGAAGDRAAIRRAVAQIPSLELERRLAYVMALRPEQVLAQMPSRAGLAQRGELINFDHLTGALGKLRQGKLIVDIYAENVPAPRRIARYLPVTALGEGSYCVDDIARTTVALLQAQQRRPRPELLRQAAAGLSFVRMMQADDGEFYNFARLQDGRIEVNRDGATSRKGINFWAVRALWALGEGYATLRASQPRAAAPLAAAVERTLPRLEASLARYGRYVTVDGRRLPAWLINDAADQSAVAVKGLVAYHGALAAGPARDRVARIITQLCDGLAAAQVTDPRAPDYGRFIHSVTAPRETHLWGSHEVEALALGGKALGRRDWVRAAARCADHYWRRATPTSIITPTEDEIAYGVETVVSGFARLHEATGKPAYAAATARWASWFVGANSARAVMYDPLSGRGYDGISHVTVRGKTRYAVNVNSGAESTVEAILALQSAQRVPGVEARLRGVLGRVLPR